MKTLIILGGLLFYVNCFSQPAIQWQKTWLADGQSSNQGQSIKQTTDGGYILAGISGGDDSDYHGDGYPDYWIVKLDPTGAILWRKLLGGTGDDGAYSIQQTTDGGYIVAGYTASNDGDVTGNHAYNEVYYNKDYWIVKLSSTGIIQWQKTLGGTLTDEAYSIQQTSDGGFIVAGWTDSLDGDVTGNHGYEDYWIVKLSPTGNIQWQKTLGGSGYDEAYSIQQTTDESYIVAGWTNSTDGDATGNHGGSDCLIVKLSSTGTILWKKLLGGSNGDAANSIQQTTDGGYVVAGWTSSNDGDVTGNHGGGGDCWIIKLNAVGDIQWQKALGSSATDYAQSIQQTTDGGYIVAGWSNIFDGEVLSDTLNYWIVKLNATGTIQWEKVYGDTSDEGSQSIQQTADGGYIVTGYSEGGMFLGSTCEVIKLAADPLSIPSFQNKNSMLIYPNPISNSTTISFSLSQSQNVSLKIFDLNGRLVTIMADKQFEMGENSVEWNAAGVNTGIYLLQFQTEENVQTRKFIVMK